MAARKRTEYVEVEPWVVAGVRTAVACLPEAVEQQTGRGPRWRVRASVDWTAVRELVTDSYCFFAPKKLAGAVRQR